MRAHSGNKEDECKKDEPELRNIEIHSLHEGEQKNINQIEDRVDEQEEQSCQELQLFPVESECHRDEGNPNLEELIEQDTQCDNRRNQTNNPTAEDGSGRY